LMIGVGIAGIGGKHAAIAGFRRIEAAGAMLPHRFLERFGQGRAVGKSEICHGGECKPCGAGIG